MLNAISVDVEDYFHVNAFTKDISPQQWDSFDTRVCRNTEKLLQLFEEAGCKATFFVLGWVAERFPELVRKIDREGHEVASHGYSHQLIYKQSQDVFKEETIKSKALLEDAIGKAVRGYRAASYSITNASLWAFDTLVEAGFEYDSSVFPVHHDVYGIADFPKKPHMYTLPSGSKIVEFPVSTCDFFGYSLPVSGGGYFRLYPYWFTRFCLNKINREERPFVFYLHPWEVDPEQPRIPTKSLLSKFRHYNNLHRCESRLRTLVRDFKFTTVEEVLVSQSLIAPSGG